MVMNRSRVSMSLEGRRIGVANAWDDCYCSCSISSKTQCMMRIMVRVMVRVQFGAW